MESENNIILSYLSSSFLFCGLDTSLLSQIAQKTTLHTYRPGHILIEEGIISQRVMLILEGLVKVYKLTPEGKELFIAIETKDNYLGLMDLVDNPGTATVETLRTTKVLSFYKKDLVELLEQNPLLWEKMYKIVLAKLNEYRELQTIRIGNNLYERTYLLLKFLANVSSDNTVPLSQETLASIVGATRPRVTETLKALQNNKKILVSPKKITVFLEK